MRTTNQIEIRADLERIFKLASHVEDWGRVLPHYRYVKVLHREANRKWVRMSAWRDFIPVTWTAVQTVEAGEDGRPGRIRFHHIKGLVRGMDVEWWFVPRQDRGDVLVGITHNLARPPFPTSILSPKLVEAVVGRGFVGYIAGKTLRQIKLLAEERSP
jgi:ribosome-associated toxin RatA of RatAB toxin-antitoxin module